MVTNPTMPSYAYWIHQGMTTFCESWEMRNSCNHHMFSEVDMWFYKHLAGIQINENGLIINPCFLSDVKWVKAKHNDIEVEWNEEMLVIDVPCNAIVIVNGKENSVDAGKHKFNIK